MSFTRRLRWNALGGEHVVLMEAENGGGKFDNVW
jgi:hypothetical protein